jgi:hypothetical protein
MEEAKMFERSEKSRATCKSFYRKLQQAMLLALLILTSALSIKAQTLSAPPATRVDNVKETIHGVEITDPYRRRS